MQTFLLWVSKKSCPFLTLELKLKSVARGLQRWSDKKVGNVKFQLALAREILHQIEIAQDSRELSAAELWLKNGLRKHVLALASLMRTIVRLRSRVNWLKEGDANTKLFHLHARFRKRKNFVAKLVSTNNIYTNHEDKARLVDEFYRSLLGTNVARMSSINLDMLGSDNHDLAALDLPFTEAGVWETIKQLPSDIAPGPDGFTGRAYKCCWSIMRDVVMAVVSAVWSR